MKRILIIKPSSMGDIIHGLLVAEAIKTQIPEVEIDWVVRREFAPLVELASLVDRVFVFERYGGWGAFFRLIREVRETHYDAVLDMQGLARSGILTLFSRADRKVGRFDAREGAGLFYGEKTATLLAPKEVHAVTILSGFLDVLGANSDQLGTLRFDKLMSGPDLPSMGGVPRRVVIFPESRRAEKNWSGYETLTRALLDEVEDAQVLWCGHVRYDSGQISDSDRFINLTGGTRIDQLPELLGTADCVVSNDSGPMHLAAAMSRPLVALFGPTDPRQFGPYPKDVTRQRVIRRPDGDMTLLSVKEVKEAIFQVIGR